MANTPVPGAAGRIAKASARGSSPGTGVFAVNASRIKRRYVITRDPHDVITRDPHDRDTRDTPDPRAAAAA